MMMEKTMNYFTEYGYSQCYPYEVVRRVTEKTLEVRAMKVLPDPAWKPEFIVGGFAGHCVNQSEQTWIYETDPGAPVKRVRLHKDGKWYFSGGGSGRLTEKPRYFYDYNF
jgi:uncharacterized ParB-like nuclease family protein